MEPAVVMTAVTKTFGLKVAVKHLDLTVPTGSLCGFIGPNGAGKTTSIRMIMSIIFPDTGDLRVLGKASAVESKDRIGYMPEERGLYRKMRVGALLNFMGRLKGVDGAGLDRKVRDWLGRLGLGDCYRKKCEELSKGMQQKVQFIATVLHEPDLLILDEPFSGLDPVNRVLLRSLLEEQNHAGRTIIFSTHAMFEAEQLCDYLFMIDKGVKVLDLPTDQVWKQYDPRAIVFEPWGPLDDATTRAMREWPGVREVVASDEAWELRLSDGADPGEVLALTARQIPVRRIEVKRASLEEIFIQIVGGTGAAPSSAQARPVAAEATRA